MHLSRSPAFTALARTALTLAALAVLPATLVRAATTPAARPNILLILSDDHSAAHVGCYGNPDIKTPNLDAFAAQGLRFDRAYVTSPQCVPSRASFFTGRSPVAIGMSRFSAPLPRDVRIYPEVLRERGWFTGVAGRTYHMDGARTSQESRDVIDRYKLATFPDRLDYVKAAGENDAALAQFREFLDLKPKDKPFVLQLCSSDPHRPLTTSGPVKHDPAKLKLPAHYPDTPAVRADFARYYDEIAHLDVWFGQVMAELEQRGLAANTLVAFMGDNGSAQFRGKGTLHEFGINVPLIVRWPGHIKPGTSTTELISGEDLAPTFLEAAGSTVPAEMTGKSFVKLLRGESYKGRTHVFAERGPHGSALPGNSSGFDLGRVVVSKTHKLIYNAMGQLPYLPVDFAGDAIWRELVQKNEAGTLDPQLRRLYFASPRPLFELYDLSRDPSELTNLAGQSAHATVERDLKAALQEWMILERDFLPLPATPEPRNADSKQGGKRKQTSK